MNRAAAIALVLLLGSVALPPAARGEIWRYTDERGVNHYVDGADSVPQRYRASARPLGLRNAPPPPPGSQPAAAPAGPSGGTQIRFTPGQRIIAEVKINGSTDARLLLDTGADRTLVRPDVLRSAGVSLADVPGQIRGVTGSTDAQAGQVDSLAVGEARVGRLIVIAHDMEQPGFDGLLGRDFLEQFRVTIDSSGGVVTIDPR